VRGVGSSVTHARGGEAEAEAEAHAVDDDDAEEAARVLPAGASRMDEERA
jgi:hypothetical protein